MAKALKKRALAEYSQTITTPNTAPQPQSFPPLKKLRLRRPPDAGSSTNGIPSILEEEINSLDPSRSSSENYRALSRILTFFPAESVSIL
jgi:hypothetical protein